MLSVAHPKLPIKSIFNPVNPKDADLFGITIKITNTIHLTINHCP